MYFLNFPNILKTSPKLRTYKNAKIYCANRIFLPWKTKQIYRLQLESINKHGFLKTNTVRHREWQLLNARRLCCGSLKSLFLRRYVQILLSISMPIRHGYVCYRTRQRISECKLFAGNLCLRISFHPWKTLLTFLSQFLRLWSPWMRIQEPPKLYEQENIFVRIRLTIESSIRIHGGLRAPDKNF
jgi:hypothetical protein